MPEKITEKYIGIDIGGSKIQGVLWNGKKVLQSAKIDTPDNLAKFTQAVLWVIQQLGPASGIGIGSAGVITGTKITRSVNIPYLKNFDVLVFGTTKLDNDAKCFARAEQWALRKKAISSVFFVTLGTGVGRALTKDGKVLDIKEFEDSELWEKEYQKIRDLKDNKALAGFLGPKITGLARRHGTQLIVIGGGMNGRRGGFSMLKKEIVMPVAKPVFSEYAAAIGAAMLPGK